MFEFHKRINRLKIKLGYRLGLSKAIAMPKMITIDPTITVILSVLFAQREKVILAWNTVYLNWINIKRLFIYSASGLKTYNFFHGASQF